MTACARHKPILVGLSAVLTCTRADLGVEIRYVAQLAVDHIIVQGSINGRGIDIDNNGDPDSARQVDAVL